MREIKSRRFKLKPNWFSVAVTNCGTEERILCRMLQLQVNASDGLTIQKIQGMSKDVVIIPSWDRMDANKIYVVLSRVRTLAGLYLLKPFKKKLSCFAPERDYLDFMREMKRIEKSTLRRIRRSRK